MRHEIRAFRARHPSCTGRPCDGLLSSKIPAVDRMTPRRFGLRLTSLHAAWALVGVLAGGFHATYAAAATRNPWAVDWMDPAGRAADAAAPWRIEFLAARVARSRGAAGDVAPGGRVPGSGRAASLAAPEGVPVQRRLRNATQDSCLREHGDAAAVRGAGRPRVEAVRRRLHRRAADGASMGRRIDPRAVRPEHRHRPLEPEGRLEGSASAQAARDARAADAGRRRRLRRHGARGAESDGTTSARTRRIARSPTRRSARRPPAI